MFLRMEASPLCESYQIRLDWFMLRGERFRNFDSLFIRFPVLKPNPALRRSRQLFRT